MLRGLRIFYVTLRRIFAVAVGNIVTKNDRNDFEMIFRELSNAILRFVLQYAGAEPMGGGGCSNTPPPIRWWKIQRPIRARV